ncbi:hypothetical protein [Methylobacterium iners]|uniref:hypothetical protein n=1 Tax=Methylobacterium iners TaxID=418707 RepID=UPI001EE16B15|nr:hypothetical protein [Methylobacterium iners]
MIKTLISVAAIGVGGILYLLFFDDISRDDIKFTDLLLANIDKPTNFSQIKPDEWDLVCYIDDYSFASDVLARELPKDAAQLKFFPNNRYVDEGRLGIVFVNKSKKSAQVFLIDNQKIYRMEGPRCSYRASANFLISKVFAPNGDYINLAIIP